MATWIEKMLGLKKRKARGPNKLPSELTEAEKRYRAVRAARARARRKKEKAG